MGQITATRNLVATKVVRHAGQWNFQQCHGMCKISRWDPIARLSIIQHEGVGFWSNVKLTSSESLHLSLTLHTVHPLIDCYTVLIWWLWVVSGIWDMGVCSLSGKTSYREISWNLEAARFGFRLFQSLWNSTGTSAAALPKCLSNFRAMRS